MELQIIKYLTQGPFENIHIPPSPGDAGSAVGAAQYLYHIYHKNPKNIFKNNTRFNSRKYLRWTFIQ